MQYARIILTLLALSAPGASSAAPAPSADHGGGAHGAPTAGSPTFDDKEALRISQAAVGRRLEGYRFTDTGGRAVTLEELRGKPVVVSLIYTSCYHICPTITQTVSRSVKLAREALGTEAFHIVTVGFDTQVDTPERMRRFARERGLDGVPGWRFLSTDAATMSRLARDMGFIYFASVKGFDHLSQTTVVDADGKVYRQVYGESFPLPALVEPLKNLVWGTKANATSWDGWMNGIKLFCTVYDPSSDRYRFDYSLFLGIFVGASVLVIVGIMLLREWRRGREKMPR